MRNVYLFQPQWAVEQRQEMNYWLPYSVGLLWSYAIQHNFVQENFTLKDLIFRRQDPQTVLDSMEDPVVCGFSCYVWNFRYCMEMARLIKSRWPDCIIVFGGPQTSSRVLSSGVVDSVVLAEGEENFLDLLRYIHEGTQVPKIFTKKRLDNLDFPSPYTSGVFDKIIADYPTALWSMVLETNRGCPYACTFCDWGSTTYSKVKRFDLTRVTEEVEWAIKNRVAFMFLADANFGIFKERDLEIAKMIRRIKTDGKLEMAVVQYAKNSTEAIFEIAKVLEDVSRGITVSVQSMHEPTLKAIKRQNMKINELKNILEASIQHQVSTYTEFILGLPEETLDSWKTGLCAALEMGQHNSMDVWFAQMLENSELNSFESKLQYGIKTVTAQDFTLFSNPTDYKGILEDIILINQTNTMSTEDIAQAYMYSWMIINFHIDGYTQILAKYAHHILGMSYRSFYDRLFQLIQDSKTFNDYFKTKYRNILHYLQTGYLSDDIHPIRISASPRLLSMDDSLLMYENRNTIYSLGINVLQEVTDQLDEILQVQKHFIFESDVNFPITTTLPYNIETWATMPTQYEISSKNANGTVIDAVTSRRNKRIKNIFKPVDTA